MDVRKKIPEIRSTPVNLTEQIHKLNRTITNMKLELINFQRKSWFIPYLARNLNDCMDDEYAFLLSAMENMRELRTKCTYLFLLDEPVIYHQNDEWISPQNLRLAAIIETKKQLLFIFMTASL